MTFRSVPWTSQPQGAVGIDLGNPITAKLKSCAIAVGGSSNMFDAATGVFAAGGSYSIAESGKCEITAGGAAWFSNGGGYVRTTRFPALPATPDISVVLVFIPRQEATTATLSIVTGTSSEVPSEISLRGGGVITARQGNDAGSLITHQNTINFGRTNVVIHTNRHKVGDALQTLWLNGVKATTDSTSSAQSGFSADSIRLNFGNGVARSVGMLVSLMYNRVLTSGECKSLSSNPYQIFQPRKLPIFVDIPIDHNIYAYTDESATTNETSEYPSTGSVFNDGSQDTNSSAESSSVLVNLNAASIEPSTSQESSTSQAALQAVLTESNASQESSTSQATLQSVLTESNASQDTQTQGATSSNTTTDTNSVTDSSIKVYTAQTTLNDTNSVVDNQTAQAQLYVARSEVNNAVESMSALAQLYAARTESFAATETSTQGASSSNNTTDSLGVTDSSTKAYTAQATLSDSNTSTDTNIVQAQFYAAKTEAATTLDSLLVQASLLAVKLETASPTDSRNTSSTFVAAQLNTVNIIDTYAAIASLTAQLHTISNSIEALLGNSISSANTLEITTALDDFYALLEQLIYQLSQVVFMNETLAFTLIPISRTTSLRAETNAQLDVPASSNNEYSRDPQSALLPSEARNTTFNSSIRLNQFLATKPITTYIRT